MKEASPDSLSVIAMVDAAWAIYSSLPLPLPTPSRLLPRGSVPSEPLEFFRHHYAIPNDVEMGVSYGNLPNPGYVRVLSSRRFEIVINSSYRGWHDAEAAVLSHEMSHVVMKVHGFNKDDRFREEIYTDSFAIFLGSCLLANFSESVDFYAEHTLSMRLGYLRPKERDYAVSVFLHAAGLPVPLSPCPPWRRSDMCGLSPATEELRRRLSKRELHFRTMPLSCPVCEHSSAISGSLAYCINCAACWRKGFWRWAATRPTSEVLRLLGVGDSSAV